MTTSMSKREQLRQKRIQKQKRQMRTVVLIIVALIVFVLAIVFLPRLFMNTEKHPTQAGFSIGDANAPIKIEEFSDFRCSHCRTFSETIEPDIIENYVDTGKVYLTFINYPVLSSDSTAAAEATYCAVAQNAVWQMKEMLFKYNSQQGAYEQKNLLDYANQIDLDVDAFSACLEGNVHLVDIEDDLAYSKQLGVQGTPTFNVNGNLVYSNELIETIDAELVKVGLN